MTLTSRTVVKILLWVFCLSFALDFKGVLKSGAETGGSGAQMIYLAIALGSSTLIAWMGRRTLLTKPGVYMLILWWGYLAFTAVVAVLNGVDLAKYMRNIVPPLLCGLGLLVAHVSACSGLRAREIVAPLAVCAGINIVWRLFFGYAVLEVTIDTARVEILSASLDWVFALVACSLLLAKRWNPRVLFLGALAIACLFLSVTRALMIPIAISGIVAGFCMLLGIRWKMFRISIIGQKAVPLAVAAAGCIMLLGLAFLIRPEMFDRWNDRLFHFGDRTSKDLSLLTREAEAVAMVDILSQDPTKFIYGMGAGSTYWWDSSYHPELWTVFPKEAFDFLQDIWSPGHSIWTYALFSGGIVGVLFHISLFVCIMVFTLRGAWMNSRFPGFEADLGFLPLVSTWCLLSITPFFNPFDERLAGLILGLMAGLPQASFVRAFACKAYCHEVVRLDRNPATHPTGFEEEPARAHP